MSDDIRREFAGILTDMAAYLEWMKATGVSELPRENIVAQKREISLPPVHKAARSIEPVRSEQQTKSAEATRRSEILRKTAMEAMEMTAKKTSEKKRNSLPTAQTLDLSLPSKTLDEIVADMGDCKRCPLHAGRQNIVFGEGDPNAELMFIGEGPGADEDKQGRPFVGRAGKELTRWIELGMKKKREEVFIANIVKCRPPNNRAPEQVEVNACIPFLQAQIHSIKPKAIIVLGNTGLRHLLGVKTGITKARNIWYEYNGIPVMPTYHPSYIIRDPNNRVRKGHVWEDLKKVMEKLGWEFSGS